MYGPQQVKCRIVLYVRDKYKEFVKYDTTQNIMNTMEVGRFIELDGTWYRVDNVDSFWFEGSI